jgi:hypothetical protein
MNIPEEIPFPDLDTKSTTSTPTIKDDDLDAGDGDAAAYDAASLSGDAAHQCSAAAVAAMRKADKDGSNEDCACAHALAATTHKAAGSAMTEADRNDEARLHGALALEHDNQKCRALLKAKS